jgi:hypothetical protein
MKMNSIFTKCRILIQAEIVNIAYVPRRLDGL